ncbi:peptidoglycan bridge formation glycyltransferase FemA/FemB family protein, partial [Candidatus Saccharibacteria bacterium]|nr:peptidoglycan bridge formation glycyltransferase FemA/FemB family protein [Candidatus Saccharibacteria bacterium]
MNWKEVVKKYPEANFLQSPDSKKMNEILGDKVIEIEAKNGFATGAIRNAKRGRYLEIPCGPLVNFKDKKALKDIFDKIRDEATREKCVFVRIRPQLLNSLENLGILKSLGLKKSPMHLAAEHTVMIDLRKSEEDLLSSMRRQTRYEVRRAEKLGIKVSRDNSEKIFKEF